MIKHSPCVSTKGLAVPLLLGTLNVSRWQMPSICPANTPLIAELAGPDATVQSRTSWFNECCLLCFSYTSLQTFPHLFQRTSTNQNNKTNKQKKSDKSPLCIQSVCHITKLVMLVAFIEGAADFTKTFLILPANFFEDENNILHSHSFFMLFTSKAFQNY